MGIINATPDSFSDGSQLSKRSSKNFQIDVDKALHRAETMVREGAIFIDVGGESTRPGAASISLQEELDRVLPVIQSLKKNIDVCISVDTSTPAVMLEAIKAGAELINDVRALSHPQALSVVSESNAAVCLMHMQGAPVSMQDSVSYENVVDEVLAFLHSKVQLCRDQDIESERIIVDPGFGFGKSVKHNYQLLKHLSRFTEFNLPVLVGLSRKSMIGTVVDRPVDQRLAGSIAATSYALIGGANIIRTHDVAATIDVIRVNSAFSSNGHE
ncbi:MAG: dihydropteroate synthase [SAR86 cluster bacterium]|uniref:dihydropteroate synthase n=1 Tax=SAR86 cluster bacterium TaxID=2030880 RepID=A0A2A5AU09_9GAMM|nr:MAG: dihydropteroate synthase [SAR86 cluster bacterium]